LALIAPEGRFTYAQLDHAASRVARALLRERPDLEEARVAHLLPPGYAWTGVQLGIWRAGGVTVPLPIAQPKRELLHVLRDSQPEVVVSDGSLDSPLGEATSELGIPMLDVRGVLRPSDPRPPSDDFPALAAARGAMILYTSGTTGLPKGVLTTHANLEAQAGSLIEAWQWSADDHVLLVLPLHHVHGILNVVTCALWSGACCTAHPRFEPIAAWNALASGELTLFMAVPTIYQRLLAAWEAADADVRARWSAGASALRLMVSGSAALPVRVLERWEEVTGHRLLERYGMTEIGMAISNPLLGERRAGHVGAPLPRVEVRLVDESGVARPEGPGEVQVKGPTVFREYWRRPAETRAAFTPDGWFRTGDVAVRERGSYRILGRASVDIVKSGGEKVSALEVEEVLREHPAIGDCAVVGVSDPDWGERLCAAVVTASGETPLTLVELRAWARARLAVWKIPKDLSHVEALPRNAMGKVDKKAVRSFFAGAT
jgi:malonyl-CoA/methylmalonyl-CoA synthetase